jgi:hypothetical protein
VGIQRPGPGPPAGPAAGRRVMEASHGHAIALSPTGGAASPSIRPPPPSLCSCMSSSSNLWALARTRCWASRTEPNYLRACWWPTSPRERPSWRARKGRQSRLRARGSSTWERARACSSGGLHLGAPPSGAPSEMLAAASRPSNCHHAPPQPPATRLAASGPLPTAPVPAAAAAAAAAVWQQCSWLRTVPARTACSAARWGAAQMQRRCGLKRRRGSGCGLQTPQSTAPRCVGCQGLGVKQILRMGGLNADGSRGKPLPSLPQG